MVKKILSYLENTDDFNGQFWHNIIKSNDNFPHAPWWNSKSTKLHDDYNPTACLAGLSSGMQIKTVSFTVWLAVLQKKL